MEPNQLPNIPPTAPSIEMPKRKPSYGGLFAIIIVLVAIVIAAFYFWGERIAETPQTPEQELQNLQMQSTSTDAAAIESDLSAESPDSFEDDFDKAFSDFEASFDAQ